MAYNFPNSPAVNDVFLDYKWDGEKWILTFGGIPKPPPYGAEAIAFLARTSGLDATHTAAYGVLIDGLVADGVWTKIDVLHIYATQDATTALLNLKSSSFNGVLIGAPTFTADRGYTGTASSTTIAINTQYNTRSSGQYVQNSAHLSVWVSTTTNDCAIGNTDGVTITNLIDNHQAGNGKSYFRLNSAGFFDEGAIVTADGFFVASRTGVNLITGFRNAVDIFDGSAGTTSPLPNNNIYALGYNNNGTPGGSAGRQSAISIGSGLSFTDVGNLYTRLRTYMTVVGVP